MGLYGSLVPISKMPTHVNYKQKPIIYHTFHQKLKDLGTKYSESLRKHKNHPSLPKLNKLERHAKHGHSKCISPKRTQSRFKDTAKLTFEHVEGYRKPDFLGIVNVDQEKDGEDDKVAEIGPGIPTIEELSFLKTHNVRNRHKT